MKKMTRLLALVMAIALILSLSVTAAAYETDPVNYDPSFGVPYTVEILVPAGDYNYVNCYGVDGYTATVFGAAGVTVSHGAESYTTRMDTHELVFTLAGDPMMRGMAQVALYNNNESDVVMTVTINGTIAPTEPNGSMDYPYTLVMGDNTADVGMYSEVYYTWTATEDGELTITPACTDWFYAVATIEHADGTYYYGDAYSSSWGETGIQTLPVVTGDIFTIAVSTGSGNAATVTLNAEFKAASASEGEGDSNTLVEGSNVLSAPEGPNGVIYSWTAPCDGTVSVQITDATVSPMMLYLYMNNTTSGEGIQMGGSVAVSKGDVVTIQTGSNMFAACNVTVNFTYEVSHTVVTDAAVPATCMEDGLTEGSHCSVCDEVLVAQETVMAPGHTKETLPAVEATCTETGLTEGVVCSACEIVLVAQEEVPVVDHTPATDAAVAPSCTETGLTEGSHCSVCETVIVAQEEVPATGHTAAVDAAVAPTCTESGLTEGSHCSVCETVIVAQEEVPATGHTPVVDAAVPATCTNTGLTEGSHCEVCDEVIVAQKTVSKLAHTYGEDDACTVCGTKKPAADSPETGDGSMIMFVLMTASAIGMGGAYGLNKKYRFI